MSLTLDVRQGIAIPLCPGPRANLDLEPCAKNDTLPTHCIKLHPFFPTLDIPFIRDLCNSQ